MTRTRVVVASLLGVAIATACGAFGSSDRPSESNPSTDAGLDALTDASPTPAFQSAKVLAQENGLYGIAVDATTIYWTNPGLKHIRAIAKPGKTTTIPDPMLKDFSEVREIQVDFTDVFFGRNACNDPDGSFASYRLSKSSRSLTGLVPTCSAGPSVRLAIDANSVIVNHRFGRTYTFLGPKSGGVVEVDSDEVPAGPVALFGSHVYWTRNSDIVKLDRDGGAFTTARPVDLAADADHLYWIDLDGALFRVPHSGDAKPERIATDRPSPSRMIVSSELVYWTNESAGRVVVVPKTGGSPIIVADKEQGPFAITADAEGVYWTNRGDGTLRMAARQP